MKKTQKVYIVLWKPRGGYPEPVRAFNVEGKAKEFVAGVSKIKAFYFIQTMEVK